VQNASLFSNCTSSTAEKAYLKEFGHPRIKLQINLNQTFQFKSLETYHGILIHRHFKESGKKLT